MTTAEIIPMRPRAGGDAESLWDRFCHARDALLGQIDEGRADMDVVCACADAYRAWLRAYSRDRIA